MTQDEIIEMARQAGIMQSVLNHWPFELKKFAELAAAKAEAKEREACALICDEAHYTGFGYEPIAPRQAKAIRARGQA
jgi:hypothetical protein